MLKSPATTVEPSANARPVGRRRAPGRLRDGFGTGRDGDYVDYFAEVKQAEFRAITDRVSVAEIDRYLTLT